MSHDDPGQPLKVNFTVKTERRHSELLVVIRVPSICLLLEHNMLIERKAHGVHFKSTA